MRATHSLENGRAPAAPMQSALAMTRVSDHGDHDAVTHGPYSWALVPETVGVVLRVAVWSGIFCLLLIGMFTYPAPVVGAFLLIVLSARLLRRSRP